MNETRASYEKRKARKSIFRRFHDDSQVKTSIKELGIFLLCLTVTIIMTVGKENIYNFYFSDMIQRLFITRLSITKHQLEMSYEQIITISDIWTFMQGAFLDGINGFADENNKSPPEKLRKLGTDGRWKTQGMENITLSSPLVVENTLIGAPRLRQYRVKRDTCNINEAFKKHFRICYGKFSDSNQEVSPEYKDTKLVNLNSFRIYGRIENYPSIYYVHSLALTREENVKILSKLKDDMWIDQATRLIMIEFNLYNANLDIFCVIKFRFEISPAGGVLPTYEILILDFLSLRTPFNGFIIMSMVIFYIMIFYYLIIEIIEIKTKKQGYFSPGWNTLDLTIGVIGTLGLIFNIWKIYYQKSVMEKIDFNTQEYVDIDAIANLTFHYDNMLGVLVFLAWMKIFKYLSFYVVTIQFSVTLKRCGKDLFGFGIMFSIIFLAFVQLGLLLFGSELEDYSTFGMACVTLIRMLLGDFNYTALAHVNRILGPLYFLSYIVVVVFILLNMFLAILNDSYAEIKQEVKKNNADFEILKSVLKAKLRVFLKSLCCCCRNKIKTSAAEKIIKEKTIRFQQSPENSQEIDHINNLNSKKTVNEKYKDKEENAAGISPRSWSNNKQELERYFEILEEGDQSDADIVKKLNDRVNRLENVLNNVMLSLSELIELLEIEKGKKK